MNEPGLNELEIAPLSVVKAAARDFAAVLSETPEFRAFEQAAFAFRQDEVAQEAMQAYQEKQQSLRALQTLGALSPEQHEELQALHRGFYQQPVVQEYLQAQSDLAALCQQLGDLLCESIGINYAAACGVSCCG